MIGRSLYLEGLKESARVFIDYDMKIHGIPRAFDSHNR